jgi:2-dehydro-3-deoxyphosphogluconate aldolase/(4S)-4-hydroxy-2-oxoglutarate aldolase
MSQKLKSPIIAIMRSKTKEDARSLAQGLVLAGITVIEFTTTTPGVFELIEEFASMKGLQVGVGTALTKSHVKNAKAAGAKFVISPSTSVDIIKQTKKNEMISIPGVTTPTDVATAISAGADFLKLFPASSLGHAYLRALRDPFPGQHWVVTGGVSAESVTDWKKAGAQYFGLGGPLTNGGLTEIADRVRSFNDQIIEKES